MPRTRRYLFLLGLLLACSREPREQAPWSAAARDPLRLDPRIAPLLEVGTARGFYDRDTSDTLAFLLEKIEHGPVDPLKRAKEELGALGEEAGGELARLFESRFTHPLAAPVLENVLDAAGANPSDAAHALLMTALAHPHDSVRQRALGGLAASRARREDFERLETQIEGAEVFELERLAVRALHRADAQRATELFLDWIETGAHPELWRDAAQLCARTEALDPGSARRMGVLYARLPTLYQAWLAAPAARAGEAESLAFLRAEIAHEDDRRRTVAVQALSDAGLARELCSPLALDGSDAVRVLAAHGIAACEPLDEELIGHLERALDDPSPIVRAGVLGLLVARGNPVAIDRALALLGGDVIAMQTALGALREPMAKSSALAERTLAVLLAREAGEGHRPLSERAAVYKAIGIVPLRAAAEHLRGLGLANDGESIEGLRAHEWLIIQAANTGAAGRAFLREELALERDSARRIDLLWAIGAARDDGARAGLLAAAEDITASPYEVLFAASRLVHLGPASVTAPRLKRVLYARSEDAPAEVVQALQELMWTWY